MKKKIVVKFGGSNFKSTEDLSHLVNVVKTYNRPLVIVVSAFSGITDKLTDYLKMAGTQGYNIDAITNSLFEVNRNTIMNNISDDSLKYETISAVEIRLKELERFLTVVNLLGDSPDFLSDTILSFGERLSSLVITAILKDKQIDCEELLPENIGMVTDGEYGNASVDFDLAEPCIREKLIDEKIYVIPGFYGVSTKGKITLFGRGGSDYSAAAIAGCINAESLDFWKDVDGFQTADPRVVESPESIRNLSYDEAAELAYFGAKILHPRTVEPLISKDIPVRIFNVYKPVDIMNPVTVISSNQEKSSAIIKSVTSNHDFAILKLVGSGLGIKKGILAKVTTTLDLAGINIKSVITSQTTINLLLSVNDLSRAFCLVENLKVSAINELLKVDDVATIAVVGHGLTEEYGIAARLFSSLAKTGINIEIISLGASSVASYFIIKKCDRENAIREIHQEFFQKNIVDINSFCHNCN